MTGVLEECAQSELGARWRRRRSWRRGFLEGHCCPLAAPEGLDHRRGGASPSLCVGRRSHSSELCCSRCTSRWLSSHNSSSSVETVGREWVDKNKSILYSTKQSLHFLMLQQESRFANRKYVFSQLHYFNMQLIFPKNITVSLRCNTVCRSGDMKIKQQLYYATRLHSRYVPQRHQLLHFFNFIHQKQCITVQNTVFLKQFLTLYMLKPKLSGIYKPVCVCHPQFVCSSLHGDSMLWI